MLLVPLLVSCGAEPESRDMRDMAANEVAGALGDLRIAAGQWQVTSRITDVRAPNLPIALRREMIGPRPAARHCVTRAQASQPSAGFLAGRGDGSCRYRDLALQGERLRGTMICAGDTPGSSIETVIDGRYGPAGYDLRMEMRNPMPDGSIMTLEIMSQGRRIGPCNDGRDR